MSRRFNSQEEADAWFERTTDPDVRNAMALVQGYLAAAAYKAPEAGLMVTDVEQGKDSEGDYESHFVVVMRSGARIRVTLDVE